MTDPRNRLRPLLHSGVPFKVNGVIDEIIQRNDPALYDWVLEAVYTGELAMSSYWRWRHDDTEEFRHPSLEPEVALKLVSKGNSALAAKLRSTIKSLCVELGFNRRNEPTLDVSGLEGMSDVTKLRILGQEPPNEWEWRREVAKMPFKPLAGFRAIASMKALENLTIIGGGGVDMGALGTLPALSRLVLVACDTASFAPLHESPLEILHIANCKNVERLEHLPPNLRELQVDDCEALVAITVPPTLQKLVVRGCPVAEMPSTTAEVTHEVSRTPYKDMTMA